MAYLRFLCPGTIWLSSCHRCTAVGHQERGGSSCRRGETSCFRELLKVTKVLNMSEMPHAVICGGVKASPGGITHAQGFPLGIPSRVWDLLVSRLGAFERGRSPQPPLPLSFGPPAVAVSSAPEGHVHQTLAAGSQLWIRAPAGKGGSSFGEEAEEVEEESDGHLSVSGCISHLG